MERPDGLLAQLKLCVSSSTEIVRKPFHHGGFYGQAEDVQSTGEISSCDLILEIPRCSGDNDFPAGKERRNEVSERLANAGACFTQKDPVPLKQSRDAAGDFLLADPRLVVSQMFGKRARGSEQLTRCRQMRRGQKRPSSRWIARRGHFSGLHIEKLHSCDLTVRFVANPNYARRSITVVPNTDFIFRSDGDWVLNDDSQAATTDIEGPRFGFAFVMTDHHAF